MNDNKKISDKNGYFIVLALHYIFAALELIKITKVKENKHLFEPSMFCYRHAYELFLKAFGNHERVHHIETLITTLKDIELSPKDKKYISEKIGISQAEAESYFIKILPEKLTTLGDKFNKYSYIMPTKYEDEGNTRFRYPEISILKRINELTAKEVKQLHDDMIELLNLIVMVYFFLGINKHGKRMWDSLG